jgi:hypothetical protein
VIYGLCEIWQDDTCTEILHPQNHSTTASWFQRFCSNSLSFAAFSNALGQIRRAIEGSSPSMAKGLAFKAI